MKNPTHDDLFKMRKILSKMVSSEKEGTDKQIKLLKLLHSWIQFELLYRKIFLSQKFLNGEKTKPIKPVPPNDQPGEMVYKS